MENPADTDQPPTPPPSSPPTPPPPSPPSSPPPTGGPGAGAGPRVPRDEMKDLGRLRRSVSDRHISGVAGGLARHLDVDPIIIRVAFVVAAFFGGAGLLAYVGAWILVPEEGTDDEPLGLDPRNRSIGLIGVGVLSLLCAVGDWAGAFWFPWQLVIVAAVVVWLLNRHSAREQPVPPYSSPAAYAGPVPHAPMGQTWQPMPPVDYTRSSYPRSPRRRGPILFFFTVALIVLAEGVLGVIDLAGADFSGSSYPALALGITAVMLLIGSFWGRAGGLISLGLVAALVTGLTTAGSHITSDTVVHTPISASQVRDSYDLGGGELVLDLSGVTDVSALRGRDIAVDSVGGRVEVIVPAGIDVSVQSQVVAGQSQVFDRTASGLDVTLDGFRPAAADTSGETDASTDTRTDTSTELSITIDLVAGEIIVRDAA